jgi:hypothetical protein
MVSLRTNLVWKARIGMGLVLGGAALLTLHVAGTWLHLTTESCEPHSLAAYVAGLRRGQPFELDRATREVYLGTVHSDHRRLAFTENWLQWTLGKVHPPLACTQDTNRLIAGSIANCSERSQILKTLAEEAGHECRFVGLSGHVVLEVRTPRGWQVADPDYGVVYPVGITQLEQAEGEPLVRTTLGAAGRPRLTIDRYWQIVGSRSDNVVLPIGSPLSPRLDVVERGCIWLALLLPLASIGAGVVLRRMATGRSRTTAASAAVTHDLPGLPARAA